MLKLTTSTIVFVLLSVLCVAGAGWAHFHWGIDGISVIGSYASVVGLILTGYVVISVQQVRKRYVRRILLDSTFRSLSERTDEFAPEATASQLRDLAAGISQLLLEIRIHLPHDTSIESLARELESMSTIENSQQVISSVKVVRPKLTAVVQKIEILKMKEEWGRDDG